MRGLYDTDILVWSEQQAALLRRLAAGESVNGVDWENVIEEVESVGRSERRAVESLLVVALRHLILAHGAPDRDAVRHWLVGAQAALDEAHRGFAPSMGQRMDVHDLWRSARAIALAKLAALGGATRGCPDACPFALQDLVTPSPDLDALLRRLAAAGD
jgi:hypothetical protein